MRRPRAILYAAKSVADRDEPLESQHERLRRAASAEPRRYQIVAEYGESNESGTTMRGPVLRRALAMIERGEAEIIMATRMDRLVRNWDLQEELRRRLLAAGGRWDLTDEPAPPMDYERRQERLSEAQRALYRELESAMASDRMTDALRGKWQSGRWIGPAPFGYRHQGRSGLVPRADEQEVYDQLVDLLLATGNVAQTLDLAREHGLKPKRRRACWTRSSLEGMMGSRAYLGQVCRTLRCYSREQAEALVAEDPGSREVCRSSRRRGEKEPYKLWGCKVWRAGQHEPLIEPERWQAVQRVLAACSGSRGRGRRRGALVYPLAGHVVCGCTTLDGQPTRYISDYVSRRRADGSVNRIRYYERADINKRHHGGQLKHTGPEPGAQRVNAQRVETWVVEQLSLIAGSDEGWQAVEAWIGQLIIDGAAAMAEIRRDAEQRRRRCLEQLEATRQRYQLILLGSDAPQGQRLLEERLDSLDAELTGCEECLADLEELAAWYRALPAHVDAARDKYRRAVEYGHGGQSYQLRDVLEDILPAGGGVTVYDREDWELHLTLGSELERLATRFGEIEVNWALPSISANVVYHALTLLAG